MAAGAIINNFGKLYVFPGTVVRQSAFPAGPGQIGINNFGTLQKTGGGSASILVPVVNFSLFFVSGGNINVSNMEQTAGKTQIDAATSLTVTLPFDLEGGSLVGYGKLVGDLSNVGGQIYPGDVGAIGTLTITGNLTNKAGGKVVIDIAGNSYDQLDVLGKASLNGEIDLNVSVVPALGTTLPILPYASHVGDFPVAGPLIYDDQFGAPSIRAWPEYAASGIQLHWVPFVLTGMTDPSISPSSGPTTGGTTVTFTGGSYIDANGWPTVTDVSFGDTPAASFSVVSNTVVTAVTQPHAVGTVSAFGGSSYTYTVSTPAPSVSVISPNLGNVGPGSTITITGSGFTGTTGVSFGTIPATSFTVNSDTQLTAVIPSHVTGTVDVTVTTYQGTSTTGAADQFTYPGAPTVTGISTTSGSTDGGSVVTLTGTNFAGVTDVLFGTTPVPAFTVNSATLITAVVPPHAGGPVDITVTTPSGTSAISNADRFDYNIIAGGSVTGVSPTSGGTVGGTAVTITGSQFLGATNVSFGNVPATSFTIYSDAAIVAIAPPQAAGTVDVQVTSPAGTTAPTSLDRFTYTVVPAPTAAGITPTAGSTAGGTVVSITGSGFTGATTVSFGTVAAPSFTVLADNTIFATAPPQAAGVVNVTVTTPSGTSAVTVADRFTYTAAPAPAVTSITPTSGSTAGGSLVTIFGSNFTGASAVSFGSQAAISFIVLSDTQLSATVPPQAAGLADVTVTTPSGTSAIVTSDQFTYTTPAVPAVSSLSATSGSTGGGTVRTIYGSGFSGATAVTFGGISATTFTVASDTVIIAVAPPHTAGVWNVQVTTPGGTSRLVAADRYTYQVTAVPAVTSLSATSGTTAGGTLVNITGSGFTGATGVSFGNVPATTFTVASDTQISAIAPPQVAGIVDVIVAAPSGTSATSTADRFTYTAAAAPTVTAIIATSGSTAGGTVITITGTNFTGASAVSFGTQPATGFTVYSSTTIVATAPPQAAGVVDITVTTPSGTSALGTADHFTYSAAPAPAITGITPTSGSTAGGTVVTITGSNFTGASAVSFGSLPASSFTVLSDTAIVATSPLEPAGTVDLTVTTPSGTSAISSSDRFIYTYVTEPAPTISSVSPNSGSTAGGTVVTMTGTNFAGATAVSFGGVASSSFTINSDTQITATAPAQAAGTLDVTVTTPSGTSALSTADQFTYLATPVPSVTVTSPTSGTTAGGTVVTLTGTNFTNVTSVSFGSTPATSFTVNSSTSLTATAPPQAAGVVDITVTTQSGTSATTAADQFTYTAAPTPAVTQILPGSGPTVGTSVGLTGSNFSGATAVFFGTTAAAFTVTSDTSITVFAPPQAAGTYEVTVSTYSGTSALSSADRFTYVIISLPFVTAVSPGSGSTAGGTAVTLTGGSFTGASGVFFGNTPATAFTLNSDSSITATAPPQAAGTVDITVTTPSGTSATSTADQFTSTAAPAPAVTGVSPNTGSTGGGTVVTITGSGFTGATAVNFGTTAANGFVVNSDTSIIATAPSQAAGTVDIMVTTYSGTSATSAADQFTFTLAPLSGVTGITPASGGTAGGTTVIMLGNNFTGASTVSFGGVAASLFTVLSDTAISVTAPAGTAGTAHITVTTPSGTSLTWTGDQFTYTAPALPAVTSLSVTSGSSSGGTVVRITGTGLSGATSVWFGGMEAMTFAVNSDTLITAVAPAQDAATWYVHVITPGGTSALAAADRFTYTPAGVPMVTSRTPTTGSTAGGTLVTITGTHFTGATAVNFGTTAATSFTVISDTQITAIAPPQVAGTVDITVTTPGRLSTISTADQYTYTAAAAPTVTGVGPSIIWNTSNAVVRIVGTGFTGASSVNFGSVAASFTVYSDTTIIATAPAQPAGQVDITVTTPSGTSATSTADVFAYVAGAGPMVNGITPASDSTAGGSTVTISGTNFTGATSVSFGAVAVGSFTVLSDTLIVAVVPAQAAGTVDIRVTTPNGTSAVTTADQFTYTTVPAPTVTGITSTSGSTAGGTVVSVSGTHFTSATSVYFGTTAATSFVIVSDTLILAVAPTAVAGTVDVKVTTPNGTSAMSSADRFTYLAAPAPSVTGVTHASGGTGGGNVVTIMGSGFSGATAVSFGTKSALTYTVLSDTMIIATAPPGAAGNVDITVTTPSGTSAISAADRFTYIAAPAPTVSSITPTSGTTAGGTLVTIFGTNLAGVTSVSFGTAAATIVAILSDGAIVVAAPAHTAGTVDITVTTYSGTSATGAGDQFTYA
jgi:hypothetical protein